jgi:hypothetical protein
MGALRRAGRIVSPVNRVALAMFAWRHRNEIANWGRYAALAVPRLVGGDTSDLLAEGRLRARYSTDPLTCDVAALQVTVADGVARLWGTVAPEVADRAVDLADDTPGITDVDDALTRQQPRSRR